MRSAYPTRAVTPTADTGRLGTQPCFGRLMNTSPAAVVEARARLARTTARSRRPVSRGVRLARVLAMPGGFPRPRFTMRVNAMMIAPIGLVTNDLCRRSPGGRAIARQTDEEAREHRGGVVQDELLVVSAGGRGHDRGDDQEARPRDGSSAEVRDGLLLGLLEVRVGAGGVVGDVDDAVDLGHGLGDRHFDALAEGDCGHAAALASAA